jgi:hypothetical protein
MEIWPFRRLFDVPPDTPNRMIVGPQGVDDHLFGVAANDRFKNLVA